MLPIRYLIPITHISVFLFTALFVGFSTYSITKDHYNRLNGKNSIPQISEKALAESKREYVIYERRELVSARKNGMNTEKVTGYAMDLNGETNIIYSFIDDPLKRRSKGTIPTGTLMSNGNIFVNGVSDNGFAILDIAGNNLTTDYKVFKRRDFPVSNILFKNEKDIVYTYGGSNSKEDDDRHKIYLLREDGKPEVLDSSTFPSNEFWLRPIGWSSKPNEFYVERASEKTTYAQLWRVDAAAKKITPLKSIKGAIVQRVRVCPKQNYAAYVSAPLNPTVGHYGQQIGPSELVFADLENDTARALLSSPSLLSDIFVSCAYNIILVKENDFYHVLKGSSERQRLQLDGAPLFFANDGKTIVMKKENKLFLLDVKSGKTHDIGEEIREGAVTKVRYTILGISRV